MSEPQQPQDGMQLELAAHRNTLRHSTLAAWEEPTALSCLEAKETSKPVKVHPIPVGRVFCNVVKKKAQKVAKLIYMFYIGRRIR